MKQTKVRINRLELRFHGVKPRPAEVARRIATQVAQRTEAALPRSLETALTERLAAILAGARRK